MRDDGGQATNTKFSSTGRADTPVLIRELTLRDGIAIVVGTVIGSGVFLVPGPIAKQLPSLSAVLIAWTVGGILSLFGALSLGELGAAFPGAGGLYVYLKHAYGRPVAFLYGWGLLTAIQTGTIATLAVGFSLYLSRLLPMSDKVREGTPIVCILALTALNCFGIRSGKMIQNTVTICKIGGLTLMITLLLARGDVALVKSSLQIANGQISDLWLPFGVALVAVLWAYEGWHVVSFTVSEFKRPSRDLPTSLFVGTLLCACIYLLSNLSYYSLLTPVEIRDTDRAAAAAVSAAYGAHAVQVISILIVVSILGSINGMILTGPRVYYAMARDGMFFRRFSALSERHKTPVVATCAQGVWASLLTLVGSFQELFTYVIFTAWIFYGLTVAAVIILRIRFPRLERPFRVSGYPLLPLSFVLAAAGITASTVIANPRHAALGLALVMLGLPVYFVFWLRSRESGTHNEDGAAQRDLAPDLDPKGHA